MNARIELETLIRARYPILYLVTWEESRLDAWISEIAAQRHKQVLEWSSTNGLLPAPSSPTPSRRRDPATLDPLAALDRVIDHVDPAIFVFKDLHPFLNLQHPQILRKLRDISSILKRTSKTLLLVSPVVQLPAELEKDITLLHLPLPNRTELGQLLDAIITDVSQDNRITIDLPPDNRELLLTATQGLTLSEAENALARILVQHQSLSAISSTAIQTEKQQIIRKNGLLEYCEPATTFDDVGGLTQLKDWLRKRKAAFTESAQAFGLPAPRGILLLGVQGCGKSLCAKAVSNLWQLPLLRFDIGRMFGSYIGSSEENVRRAISIAESVAPAILWIDEMDKALAGSQGSAAQDGGTTARVFSTLLTWLSEKQAPVFVVATANNVQHLPAELLRKGRLDEIFFLDLPQPEDRQSILKIHLHNRNRNPAAFELDELAALSPDFSGAELEQAVISALYDAYDGGVELTTQHLRTAITQTVPLAKTMSEQVTHLRQWAAGRARSAG
ncbi:MAG: ATP-dependent zinc metalloprotease FtsH [Verrucomicrobiota bacterium]|jgi:SpoVK/Ycf46/Vps4 family AAA+-type ATPase